MPKVVRRVLPSLEGPTAFFWTSGEDGRLRFLGCSGCGYLIHPPASFCPRCEGRAFDHTAVSGRGTLHTFTVNHQPWDGVGDVYVIAIVEIDEQPGLRLTTNIIDVDPEELRIGTAVEVAFEQVDGVYLPMFRPSA